MAANPSGTINSQLWLMLEFAALYIGAPLAIALFLPPDQMFLALLFFSVAGTLLLWGTGGFNWQSLFRGRLMPWWEISGIALAVFISGYVILSLTYPDARFFLLQNNPKLILIIWCFYPLLSALPQELIFRPLFFHRYAKLLPSGRGAIALNAAIFAFAHLMYWSWIVGLMTFIGGWIFGRAYLRHGFPAAWVLHAVAGNILFLVGMGYYFYSGNVVRPF